MEKQLAEDLKPLPFELLKPFPPVGKVKEALAYLKRRGINPKTTLEYDLRWDEERRRVVFPAFDADGNFMGAMGRFVLDDDKVLRWLSYWLRDRRKHTLFGEHRCRERKGKIMIVEGPVDALALAQADKKVLPLATFGAAVSYEQLAKIASLASSSNRAVFLWPDRDEGGRAMLAKASDYLRNLVLTMEVPYRGDAKDPAAVLQNGGVHSLNHLLSDARLL